MRLPNKLECQLNDSPGLHAQDSAEASRGYQCISRSGVWSIKIDLIECVEEFAPKLSFQWFPYLEIFHQCQIRGVQCRSAQYVPTGIAIKAFRQLRYWNKGRGVKELIH